MNSTEISEIRPGVPFAGTNGNREVMDDCVLPDVGDATDWIADRDGNELRAGDWATVVSGRSGWEGDLVEVTGVRRGAVYSKHMRTVERAWSPSSHLNHADIKNGRSSTGASGRDLRRADLSEADRLKLELRELYRQRAENADAISRAYGKKAAIDREIRGVEDDLNRAEFQTTEYNGPDGPAERW